MPFLSYNYRAYCLLNLATKKFESEISRVSVKFKRNHMSKREFEPFKLALFFKSEFAQKFDNFKIQKIEI